MEAIDRIILLYPLLFACYGSVLKNVSLPPIEYASYNSTNEPLQIDCAEQWVMDMPGFAAMEKIWNKDHEVDFDTTDIVFGGKNESIQFSPLLLDDSGNYACCLRNAGEVEYYCTTRNLTVVETGDYLAAILDSSMNSTTEEVTPNPWIRLKLRSKIIDMNPIMEAYVDATVLKRREKCISERVKHVMVLCYAWNDHVLVNQPEPTNGTVWNVRLGINETLDARDNHTYFLMLFNGNATVHCTLNGEKPSVETTKLNISDPSLPTDYDVVIRSFNATAHSGNYFCNGTYLNGNETETEEVYFSVIGPEFPSSCGNCTDIKTHYENTALNRLAHVISFLSVFVMF